MSNRPINYDELSVGDPVITRDGRKARILCTDFKGSGGHCIVFAVESADIEIYGSCDKQGRDSTGSPEYDLFLPPKVEKIRIYQLKTNDTDTHYPVFKACSEEQALESERCSTALNGYKLLTTVEVEL